MSGVRRPTNLSMMVARKAGVLALLPVVALIIAGRLTASQPIVPLDLIIVAVQSGAITLGVMLIAGFAAHQLARDIRKYALEPSHEANSNRIPAEVVTLADTCHARLQQVVSVQRASIEAAQAALSQSRLQGEVAARAKNAFLAHMSHEVRTPMTTILGDVSLLDEPGITPRQRSNLLRNIRLSADHLLGLINDLLDLSQIESGAVAVHPRPISAVQAFEEVVSFMQPRAVAKGIALNSEASFPLPSEINADPLRLRQILLNLVANAIRYTDSGGVRVTLSCDAVNPSSPSIRFDIADTGSGIESSRLADIFEPFVAVGEGSRNRGGGIGVGLAISHRLAELMNARLEVVSNPGVGSVFSLIVPIDPAQAESLTFARDSGSDRTRLELTPFALEGMRVLYCEDGADNQRLVKFFLEKAGASVVLAANGRIGVDTYLAARTTPEKFDLVLMDIQMPVLDGYSATAELRRHGVDIPIIALTAHAMTGERERCLAAGCDDFATKPIDRDGLIELCATWRLQKSSHGHPHDIILPTLAA